MIKELSFEKTEGEVHVHVVPGFTWHARIFSLLLTSQAIKNVTRAQLLRNKDKCTWQLK